jgi:hypothetical protein
MDDSWKSFEAQVGRREGKMGAVVEWGRKQLESLENLNIVMENVMRLSTFDVLVSKGISSERAAQISRDLTTNFTRRGYHTQALNTWWLFYNATVQGNMQVINNLLSEKNSKRLGKMVVGTMMFSFLLDQMGRAMSEDEDKDGIKDWDAIPDWKKERNIIVPFKVGDAYITIPAPWVFNTFWRAGSLASEATSGVTKAQDAALDLTGVLLTTFNPIAGETLPQKVSPTAFDPFMQVIENRDHFGNPLGPTGYPGASKRPDAYLAWGNTPELAKDIAQWANEFTGGSAAESGLVDLRPSTLELAANTVGGSLGRFIKNAADTVGVAIDPDEKLFEDDGLKNVPILRQFGTQPSNSVKTGLYHDRVAKVYAADKLTRVYSSGPEKDLEKLREVKRERAGELRMVNQAKDVERQLREIRGKVRRAQARGDLTTEKVLKDRMERLMEQFNSSYARRVGN